MRVLMTKRSAGRGLLFAFLFLLALMVMNLILLSKWNQEPVEDVFLIFPLNGYTVVIDPGHGGYDPGVTSDGVIEKDIVLDISYNLRDYLKNLGADVVMTREGDYDLIEIPASKKQKDLSSRIKIMNESGGDVMVSVHVNAITSSIWHGAQTFYSPDNHPEESKRLAFLIQEEIIKNLGNTDRYAKIANYYVLQESPMPAVIAEVGFISNPQERELLKDPVYRRKIAAAITMGLHRYLKGERADEPDFIVSNFD